MARVNVLVGGGTFPSVEFVQEHLLNRLGRTTATAHVLCICCSLIHVRHIIHMCGAGPLSWSSWCVVGVWWICQPWRQQQTTMMDTTGTQSLCAGFGR